MLTRAQNRERQNPKLCIATGCSYYQVSNKHMLCTGCSVGLPSCDSVMLTALGNMGAKIAGSYEFNYMRACARYHSNYCIEALLQMGREIQRDTLKENNGLVYFTSKQVKALRNIMYDKIMFWQAAHHRQIIDGILLSFCFEPWKCRFMEKESLCYFGHFGETFIDVASAVEHCKNIWLVLRGLDSTHRNLWDFCKK